MTFNDTPIWVQSSNFLDYEREDKLTTWILHGGTRAVAAALRRRFIVLYTYNLLSLAPYTWRYVCHMTEWLIIEYREFKGIPLPLHLKQSSSMAYPSVKKKKKLKIFNNNQKWVWPEMLKSWYDLQSFIVCGGQPFNAKMNVSFRPYFLEKLFSYTYAILSYNM